MARVRPETITGDDGESAVINAFDQFGWSAQKARRDHGTDLIVQTYDTRGYDLQVFVGVQVKSGKSYFRTESEKDGNRGWYFRSDCERFEEWAAHSSPHLLVLHHPQRKVSYWAHITMEEVETAGKSCKIFVPESQTIDKDHLSDLVAVATSSRGVPGDSQATAFTASASNVPAGQRLRFALVAPRLIAPHRNAGFGKEISAEEGIALLVQGRFSDLKRFADEHEGVPHPDDVAEDAGWAWRFVAAIWEWVFDDTVGGLRSAFEAAPDEAAKAASGVFLACALLRLQQHTKALKPLDGLLAADQLGPEDHGWVLAQRARVKADIGDADGSRSDAEAAIESCAAHLDDCTARAFDAIARWQLVALDPGNADFGGAIGAADNLVSWWRAQTVSWAFAEAQGAQFRSWAEPNTIVLGGGNQEAIHLLAAELNADLAGDHIGWKALAALRARQQLMGAADTENEMSQLAEGLDALRLSGDNRSLAKAAEQLIDAGPVDAVAEAVAKIPVNGWTHTTALGNFDLLAAAGDLLNQKKATAMVKRCGRLAFGNTGKFAKRVRPWFWIEYKAIQAVARLLPAADSSAHRYVAMLLAEHPDQLSRIPARDIERVVDNLDSANMDPSTSEALWQVGQQDEGCLGAAVLGWLAESGHDDARAAVIGRAADRDSHALSSMPFDRADELDAETAEKLIEWFEDMAATTLSAALRHEYSFGGSNGASLLAEFNFLHRDLARWERVTELLVEPLVDSHSKREVCALIAQRADKLPPHVRSEIEASIDSIAQAAADLGDEEGTGGIHLMLKIALGIPDDDTAEAIVAELASGSRRDRADAAALLGSGLCPNSRPILAGLIADRHLEVRRVAAIAVGRLLCDGASGPIDALARKLAENQGSGLPLALLHGLRSADQQTPMGRETAQRLQEHPSARVRRLAANIPE